MVETLVAFTVLAIILTVLYHIVSFCSELRMLTVDNARLNREFLQEVAKLDDKIDTNLVQIQDYAYTAGDGKKEVLFYLTLDEDRMKEAGMESYENNGNDVSNELSLRFEMNCLGARSYLCTDQMITDEQLTAPSVMHFVFNSLKNVTDEGGTP